MAKLSWNAWHEVAKLRADLGDAESLDRLRCPWALTRVPLARLIMSLKPDAVTPCSNRMHRRSNFELAAKTPKSRCRQLVPTTGANHCSFRFCQRSGRISQSPEIRCRYGRSACGPCSMPNAGLVEFDNLFLDRPACALGGRSVVATTIHDRVLIRNFAR